MGLELNPLLPRLGSLQRQLFSPYGGDGAPPPLLSNDAFLTDTPERALDSGEKVSAIQCLLGCRRERLDAPLTKPAWGLRIYMRSFLTPTPPRHS